LITTKAKRKGLPRKHSGVSKSPRQVKRDRRLIHHHYGRRKSMAGQERAFSAEKRGLFHIHV